MKTVIMTREEATAWFVAHVDWEPSYFLGSVPTHLVDAGHWFARHRDELPADVIVVEAAHEATLWRAISDHDTRCGRPPSRAIVISGDAAQSSQ